MEELNDTTRRFPRTLAEAFPDDPELSTWIYRDPETLPLGYYAIAAVFICFFILASLLLRNICTT
jgi:hypothetical protein